VSRKRSRGNSEGSIYPVPGGWRAYAWVTGPDGIRRRKYVKAVTYEDAQRAWLKLRAQADRGPVASNLPTLREYLAYWLSEVVKPNLAPKPTSSTSYSLASTSSRTWAPSGSTS